MTLTPNPLRLTPHQRIVYDHLVQGRTNLYIAACMGITEKAVKCLVTRILKKTLCVSRGELMYSHYQGHVTLQLVGEPICTTPPTSPRS